MTARILDAAREVFLKDGFEGASLDAIALAAGTSKRTFYVRFKSKADVFEATVRRMIEDAFLPLAAEDRQCGTHRERLHRLSLAILTNALTPEIAAMERMIIGEAFRFPDIFQRLNELGRMRSIALIESCLIEGINSGEFFIKDTGHAAEYFLNAMIRMPMIQAATGIIPPELSFSRRERLRMSVDLFIDGLGRKF